MFKPTLKNRGYNSNSAGKPFPKQIYKRIFKYKTYKKLNSDLWGTLYSSNKRCRVVRRLYYLFASIPVIFPRSTGKMKPIRGIRVKSRSVFQTKKKRPDYFKVLCNLKFRSHGGLKKPGKGSKFKKKNFNLYRLKTFYGNYS
jgi:hypothetical protein